MCSYNSCKTQNLIIKKKKKKITLELEITYNEAQNSDKYLLMQYVVVQLFYTVLWKQQE